MQKHTMIDITPGNDRTEWREYLKTVRELEKNGTCVYLDERPEHSDEEHAVEFAMGKWYSLGVYYITPEMVGMMAMALTDMWKAGDIIEIAEKRLNIEYGGDKN